MAKSIGEKEREEKKFQELVPEQLMIVAFGKTPSGKYVPLKVNDEGVLQVS